MKEQILQPAPLSRTLQGKARESNTASVSNVLQAYKNGISQRQEVDEDELLQGKFETAQRDELEDEELLQGKFETTQRKEAPNNTGLPDNLKAGVEQLSGLDMSDVKVHYNSSKPASVQAYAYTQGTDIHVAPGQEKHLGHEAWHVAQQKQGRVQPTTSVGGMPVNDDAGLENEADVMGGKAVQMKQKENKSRAVANPAAQKKTNAKQRVGFVDNRPDYVIQNKVQRNMYNYFEPKHALNAMKIGKRAMQLRKSTVVDKNQMLSKKVIQCKTSITYTNGMFNYSLNGENRSVKVGVEMEAYLDVKDPKEGTSPGGEQDELMMRLKNKYDNNKIVKGHLLNSRLGGLGIAENLFPITVDANNKHKYEVENHVKSKIKNRQNVYYRVNVENAEMNENSPTATFHCHVKADDEPILDKEIRSNLERPNPPGEVWTTMDPTDDLYKSIEFLNRDLPKGWGEKGNGLRGDFKRHQIDGNIMGKSGVYSKIITTNPKARRGTGMTSKARKIAGIAKKRPKYKSKYKSK